jgi:hypothetical protein
MFPAHKNQILLPAFLPFHMHVWENICRWNSYKTDTTSRNTRVGSFCVPDKTNCRNQMGRRCMLGSCGSLLAGWAWSEIHQGTCRLLYIYINADGPIPEIVWAPRRCAIATGNRMFHYTDYIPQEISPFRSMVASNNRKLI